MAISATFLFSVLAVMLFLKTVAAPARSLLRMGTHCAGGILCLWILNTVSGFTGILLPVNPVTVAMAAFGGLPGIGLVALLRII